MRPKLKLAVPDLITNSYFPALAAVELGFFEREGLDVEIELVAPTGRTFAALRDGAADFVVAEAHAAFSAFPAWQGLKLLCAMSQGMYWFLVMRPDIARARGDLSVVKGCRIAAAPWVELGLKQLLRDAGFDLQRDAITIAPLEGSLGPKVNIGVTAALALQERRIDGFWANGMGAELAVRRGAGTIVLDVRRGDGPASAFGYTLPVMAARAEFVDKAPKQADAAVRAIKAAMAALKADVSLATKAAARLFPDEERGLIAELVQRDLPYYDATLSRETFASLNRFSRQCEILTGDPDYDAIVVAQTATIL